MQYAFLIYAEETDRQVGAPDDLNKAYTTFTDEVVSKGLMRGGAPLAGSTAATSVRVKDGKTLTTDGPFAETKEQLGGFYIVEVPNLEEALKWAGRCPGALDGAIEVRPIMEVPMPK